MALKANQKRDLVAKCYSEILGRNIYSQDVTKRECVYKKHTDGKYYSDCSSSVRQAYKKANIGLDYIGGNTAGIYNKYKDKEVKVTITNGIIKDTSNLLRVGDILLFRGSDVNRPRTIGHVEIVSRIVGTTVYCYGHGSGVPSEKDLYKYCMQRYNMRVNTPSGNRGIECVLRLIDDNVVATRPFYTHNTIPNSNTKDEWVLKAQKLCNKYSHKGINGKPLTEDSLYGKNIAYAIPTIKKGDKNPFVELIQERLTALGYDTKGIDGIYGNDTYRAIIKYKCEVLGIKLPTGKIVQGDKFICALLMGYK